MHARSTRTAGRTGDRPAGGRVRPPRRASLLLRSCLVLLAISAIGASRGVAVDGSGDLPEPTPTPAAAATASPTPTAEEIPGPTPVAEAPEPAPAAPASTPSEPAPAGTPAAALPAAPAPTAAGSDETPAPAEPLPTPQGGDEPAPPAPGASPEPTPAGEPDVPQQPEALAVAQNVSFVFQVLWQVQEGCQSYCQGTSQSQSGVQTASVTQTAVADAGGSTSSGAVAANTSTTVQFLWQYQVGCVAFCYGTTLSQSALQTAQTVQLAAATATLGALALNLAETLQFAWQVQLGCEQECHGTSESQSLEQSAATIQAAGSSTSAADEPSPVADGIVVPPSWLVALAASVGATIELIYQMQEAPCVSQCVGGTQVQEAGQRASVTQLALAALRAEAPPVDAPAPPPLEPGGGSPPAAAVLPAPGTEQPAAPNATTATATGVPSDSWDEAAGRPGPRRRHTHRRVRGTVPSPFPSRARRSQSPPAPAHVAVPGRRVSAAAPPRRARTVAVHASPASPGLRFAAPGAPDSDGPWHVIALVAASLALVAGSMAVRHMPEKVEILD